jgi:hypothetical protein
VVFQYFVEGRKHVNAADLFSLGLSRSLRKPTARECLANTPSGAPGCVFLESDSGRVPRMDMASQTWVKRPGGLWVGWDNDAKPTPEQLARESQLPGKAIELADSTTWKVPTLREWRLNDTDSPPIVYQIKVPRLLDCNEAGKWVEGDVVAGYREIWDRSAAVFDLMVLGSQQKVELDDSDLISFAVDLLAINYRIGSHEVSALGLLTIPLAREVIRSGIDAEGYEMALESHLKNELSRSELTESNAGYGAERLTMDEATSTPTAQPVAS